MRIIDDALSLLVVPADNWPEATGTVITRASRAIGGKINDDRKISRSARCLIFFDAYSAFVGG